MNVEFGTEEALTVVLSSMEETPRIGGENSKENRVIGMGWDGNGFEEERKVTKTIAIQSGVISSMFFYCEGGKADP